MVKNWVKFNESKESLSKEMMDEIMFYFGEGCRVNGEVEAIYDDLYRKFNFDYTLYEAGYDEMKEYSKILYNKAKGDALLEKGLINVYKLIREDISIFPEFYEIEDIYLNIIENEKFNLYTCIKSDNINKLYTIKLKRKDTSLPEFIEFCNTIKLSLPRIQSNKYRTEIVTCSYSIGYTEFEIELNPFS